jgi:hypothetical protein
MSVYDDSDSESKSEAKKSSRFLDPDEGQNISTTIEPGVIPDSKNDLKIDDDYANAKSVSYISKENIVVGDENIEMIDTCQRTISVLSTSQGSLIIFNCSLSGFPTSGFSPSLA